MEIAQCDSARVKNANSIAIALNQDAAQTEALPRIVLSPDQLKPLDPVSEDQAVDKETDHQKGLKRLAEYLSSALWEQTKETGFEVVLKIVSMLDRVIEGGKHALATALDRLRGWCELGLATLYKTGHHEVVPSPDKIDQKNTSQRNRAVRFLSVQKSRAIDGLSDRVRNPKGNRSPAEQRHAARALAAMLGRRVRHDALDHARTWLRQGRDVN